LGHAKSNTKLTQEGEVKMCIGSHSITGARGALLHGHVALANIKKARQPANQQPRIMLASEGVAPT